LSRTRAADDGGTGEVEQSFFLTLRVFKNFVAADVSRRCLNQLARTHVRGYENNKTLWKSH
jgi:hypothetical protein